MAINKTLNSTNNAVSSLTIDPGASGDSYFKFWRQLYYDEYYIGIDDSDGDSFKISGASDFSDPYVAITQAGEITKSYYPVFNAYVSTAKTNVTGNGTTYTVVYDAEYMDPSGQMNAGSGVFTAPRAGKYLFNASVQITDSSAISQTVGYVILSTTARDYTAGYINLAQAVTGSGSGTRYSFPINMLVDMDINNTARIKIVVSGGSNVIDVTTGTYFSGALIC